VGRGDKRVGSNERGSGDERISDHERISV
jgi:hypothetical protein